ncbi:hypothetical protein DPMN_072440 [Dreissena polymorpha]|uniref:Uncharacterized protein n=1 Tax=Dreissena polymorpha TaxID=45954 RepID=A0A9D3Z6G3_DREPO|nr:hypothetical protein DPMN_072440 [Dreissena polymorpha]
MSIPMYLEIDDESCDEHSYTLYEVSNNVDEGCLHVDVCLVVGTQNLQLVIRT